MQKEIKIDNLKDNIFSHLNACFPSVLHAGYSPKGNNSQGC